MFQLTTQYKNGIIKLAALLALLCFFIAVVNNHPIHEPHFKINEEVQCAIDNQKLILAEAKENKKYKFKYNVNKLTDFQGYQLGLKVNEIDLLLEYRKKGELIYGLKQFQDITKVNVHYLDSISEYLLFPKQKKSIIYNSKVKKVVYKRDLNKVSVEELKQLGLPNKIAYRVINYRNYLGTYHSMSELKKVYDIEQKHLDILKNNFIIK